MPGAPQIKGNDDYAVRRVLKMGLVEGLGSITASGGSVSNGVCTINVDAEYTYPQYSTILVSGVSNKVSINNVHRVIRSIPGEVSFETGESNGALTTGSFISVKGAPAGWEVPFTETSDDIVFRSLDPTSDKYFLRIRKYNYQGVYAKGYWDMLDMQTGITGFPPDYEAAGTNLNENGLPWPKSYDNNASNRHWVLIADTKRFYFCVWSRGDSGAAVNQVGNCVFFGDFINELPEELIDRNSTFITGHATFSTMVTNGGSMFGYNRFINDTICYLAKDYQLSIPKRGCTISHSGAYGQYTSSNAGSTIPDWRHGKFIKTPWYVADNQNNLYGRMPGMFFILNRAAGAIRNLVPQEDQDDNNRPYLPIYVNNNGVELTTNPHSANGNCILIDLLGPWE